MRYDSLICGSLSGIGLMIVSLWFWHQAPEVAGHEGAVRTNLMIYSIRFASVAGMSAAQVVLLTLVVARIYRPTVFDHIARGAAGLMLASSLAAAIAFAVMAIGVS